MREGLSRPERRAGGGRQPVGWRVITTAFTRVATSSRDDLASPALRPRRLTVRATARFFLHGYQYCNKRCMIRSGGEAMAAGAAVARPNGSAHLRGGLLEVQRIAKGFAGVPVLHDVGFAVGAGEVVMLVGENGAGKSTLKNILSGLLAPDAGEIRFRGERFAALTTADADRLGIGTIHQELSLFGNLSVAENIHLPHLPHRVGFMQRRAMRDEARSLLHDMIGTDIDPD